MLQTQKICELTGLKVPANNPLCKNLYQLYQYAEGLNVTVWYLTYLRSVSFATLWVVGHCSTLPHARYPLPSQLLSLHSLHCLGFSRTSLLLSVWFWFFMICFEHIDMIHLCFLRSTRSSAQEICVTNFLNHFIRSRVYCPARGHLQQGTKPIAISRFKKT